MIAVSEEEVVKMHRLEVAASPEIAGCIYAD